MPDCSSSFSRITHGVEVRWTRAQSPQARPAQSPHHPAGGREVGEVCRERCASWVHCMLAGQGEGDAILAQVIADAHLATEAIAPVVDGHVLWIIWEGVNQHRHAADRPSAARWRWRARRRSLAT